VSHPEGLPNLFIDRSLGRIRVPTILRAEGLRLVTLAERYGIPADESVTDVQWLTDAGRNGEIVFMKDERIRYNEAEKAAVKRFSVKCFCLSRGGLKAPEMAGYFLGNLRAIVRACEVEGPLIAIVYRDSIRRVVLDR
jgi:hypothetical protein